MAFIVTRTLSSSSTIRILPLGNTRPRDCLERCLRRAADRQRNRERRAPASPAAHAHVAAMTLHDPEGDPETQASALPVLSREERLEDVRQVFVGDARAGIADLDVHR